MAALSALRTDLYTRLNDTNNRIVTSAQANSLLNQGLREWANRTGELRVENAYAVTAKQFDYAAPTDMHRLLAAYWAPNRQPLKILNQHEFMDIGGYTSMTSGVPTFIMVEGVGNAQRLRLFPAPSATSSATTINDTGGINTTDTTCGVTDYTKLRAPFGWVVIENEKILYQNLSATQMLLMRRAMGGTTAATHADTTAVTQCDLHIIYERVPTTMSADADTPDMNPRFQDYLVYHALAGALRMDRRDDAAAVAEAKWERAIREGTLAVKRSLGASPATVIDAGY